MKAMFFFLLLPLCMNAQGDLPAQIDKYLQSARTINNFSGVVLIAKGNNIIYKKCFGFEDLASRRPMQLSSVFEIGRITEQFTAAAVLLEKQRGHLNLSDKVTRFLPSFPYQQLTIHDLLTHRTGLKDYYEMMKDSWSKDRLASNQDILPYINSQPVPADYTPPLSYHDSPTDYAILACIIEKIAGVTYEKYMTDNIFIPLKLTRTRVTRGLHFDRRKYPNHTEGICFTADKKLVSNDEFVPSVTSPNIYAIIDGIMGTIGISSTAEDLFRWNRALRNNLLLKAPAYKLMTSALSLQDSSSNIYFGYGTLNGSNEIGRYELVQEMGTLAAGYAVSVIHYSEYNETIIYLSNNANNKSYITGPLAYILHQKTVVPLYIHKPARIDTSVILKYAGNYLLPTKIELVSRNGQLYLRFTESPEEKDILMLPESENKIYSTSEELDMQFEFLNNKEGKTEKIFVIMNGLKKEIKKI